jgi:DNA-binding transcriptional MerR regulator
VVKDKPIAEAAQAVAAQGEPCSEGTLRRLDRLRIVKPDRDPWGRRLFGDDDVAAARQYLRSKRSKSAAA